MPCCLNASSSSLASMSCESTAVSRGKFDVRVDHRLERASEKQARTRNRLGRIAAHEAGERGVGGGGERGGGVGGGRGAWSGGGGGSAEPAIDRGQVVFCRCLTTSRLEERENLRAAAEAEKRSPPAAHRARKLSHSAEPRVPKRTPIPKLCLGSVPPPLEPGVPIVLAAPVREPWRGTL